MRKVINVLIIGVVAALLLVAIYFIPPVHEKLAWRVDELQTRIKYVFNPPEKVVFIPQNTIQAAVQTLQAVTATSTVTPQPSPSGTLPPSATPTITPTPLPPAFNLTGITYTDQHGYWNYCAPANLTMTLSYWKRKDSMTTIGKYVKPYDKDKNVMPYELAQYVTEQTDLGVLLRYGGTPELLKRSVVAGFPVLVEKGAYIKDTTGVVSWMGHYEVVTGYDDAKSEFIVQDSFFSADYPVGYDAFISGWRAFNYAYLMIYPPEREAEVLALLGADAVESDNQQRTADLASVEVSALTGVDQFFAWFNRGTSLVALTDYAGAAAAFDQAFAVYATLPEDKAVRPYRMLWYQTGPFFAYYYTGRYYDVISLASTTLDSMSDPTLEESFVWRARAKLALGDTDGAVEDLRSALKYHADFTPAVQALESLGLQ